MSEPAGAEDLVFGIHAVERLIAQEPSRVRVIWIQEGAGGRLLKLASAARAAGIRVERADRRALDRRARRTEHGAVGTAGRVAHQGVMAQCHAATLASETELELRFPSLPEPLLVLALEEIQDPRNLGACLRSADACAVTVVLLSKRRTAPVNSLARKAASGATESLFLVEVTNLVRRLEWLKERGVWVVGAITDAPKPWSSADFRRSVAIVVGGEERGLRALTRRTCDELVSIPMRGSVESLNVSVATGVLLFEALRQRSSTLDAS